MSRQYRLSQSASNWRRDSGLDYSPMLWNGTYDSTAVEEFLHANPNIYDYGLSGQLDRLTKYGKQFWVTEFANWHPQNDGAQIDTLAKQEAQMTDMVATCTDLGKLYLSLPYTGQ